MQASNTQDTLTQLSYSSVEDEAEDLEDDMFGYKSGVFTVPSGIVLKSSSVIEIPGDKELEIKAEKAKHEDMIKDTATNKPAWVVAILSFLEKFTIEEIDEAILKLDESSPSIDIKWIKNGCSLGEALSFMKSHKITGAPVFSTDECLGFLELFDVMSFLVKQPRPRFFFPP